MTKPLWAPWRLEYIEQADEQEGCIFCRACGGDDDTGLVVHRGSDAFVLLNKFPYASGHLMVAPYRHTGELAELTDGEVVEIHRLASQGIAHWHSCMAPRASISGGTSGASRGPVSPTMSTSMSCRAGWATRTTCRARRRQSAARASRRDAGEAGGGLALGSSVARGLPMVKGRMSDPDTSFRQRLGSRIERHVLRSAVDILDERGTELDTVDRDLQQRESDLRERSEQAAAQEADVEHRERRLAELGAKHQRTAADRPSHPPARPGRGGLAQVRVEARNSSPQLTSSRGRSMSVSSASRRQSTVVCWPRPTSRGANPRSRRASRSCVSTTRSFGARYRSSRRGAGLLAHDRRLAERERRVDASEADLRKRLESVERREREARARGRASGTRHRLVDGPRFGLGH